MYTIKVSALVFFCQLSISSLLAAKQAHAQLANITAANVDEYEVPFTNPTVTIAFFHLDPGRPIPIDPPSVYMCAIENLAKICRYNPRTGAIVNPRIFNYGTAAIRLERLEARTQPNFSYTTACGVLRGLAEFMTLNHWWFESFVDVSVDGIIVGSAQLWNPHGEAMAASIDLIETQNTTGSVAAA